MAATKKKRRPKNTKKTYRFQLTLPGIAGIGVVCFCLFLWMFLLGIWAGQTFLLPTAKTGGTDNFSSSIKSKESVETLISGAKKKPSAQRQK